MPEKQYFAETRIVETDRVAVFTKFKETSHLNSILSEILVERQIRFELKEEEKFEELQYLLYIKGLKDPLVAGFILEEKDEGTEITGYFHIESLQYPLGRWKGYFIPFMYKRSINEFIDHLIKSLTQ